MSFDPSVFTFGDVSDLDARIDFVATLPRGLSSRGALFDALRRELNFPDYFGSNWDALADCLRDLSWVERRRVVLLHQELPALDDATLATYFEVLAECVRDWKPDEQHELVVAFPREAHDEVARLAALGT